MGLSLVINGATAKFTVFQALDFRVRPKLPVTAHSSWDKVRFGRMKDLMKRETKDFTRVMISTFLANLLGRQNKPRRSWTTRKLETPYKSHIAAAPAMVSFSHLFVKDSQNTCEQDERKQSAKCANMYVAYSRTLFLVCLSQSILTTVLR